MNCRYCHKEFDEGVEYCPHCGVATKPPAETENRQGPNLTNRIIVAIMILLFFGGIAVRGLYKAEITVAFVFLFIMLGLLLFVMAPGIYDVIKGRKIPLMKRVAVVAAKRYEEHGEDQGHHVTFAFPDNMCLEFSEGWELDTGDRVILKYKKVGQFEKPVFYGYERLEEQTNK